MIFYINIPVGILAAILTGIIIKGGEKASREESFDWAGAVCLAVFLGAFLTLVSQWAEWGLKDLKTMCLIWIVAVSGPLLVRIEIKKSQPIILPSLLRIRLFTTCIIAGMIMFTGLFTVIFLMPFFLLGPVGLSEGRAGLVLVTPFIFLFLGAPVFGALYDRLGSRMLSTFGMTLLATSLFTFTFISDSPELIEILWRLGLMGLGVSIFSSPNSAAVLSAVPSKNRGTASAMLATARNLGMVLGVAFAATIFHTSFYKATGYSYQSYSPALKSLFMNAFHSAMFFGFIASCTGIVVAFLRGNDRPSR